MGEKNLGGRPLKFQSVEELEVKIEEYFNSCYEERIEPLGIKRMVKVKHPTVTGLAVALDTDRQTLLNYEERPEYFDTIKRAKSRIEAELEQLMLDPTNRNATGAIFNAKNNFGWKDKQEIDFTDKTEYVIKKPEF